MTLTISNENGPPGPGPAPEIAIKRRLYRSGESEYFLNGQAGEAASEVRELFWDTGIGKTRLLRHGAGHASTRSSPPSPRSGATSSRRPRASRKLQGAVPGGGAQARADRGEHAPGRGHPRGGQAQPRHPQGPVREDPGLPGPAGRRSSRPSWTLQLLRLPGLRRGQGPARGAPRGAARQGRERPARGQEPSTTSTLNLRGEPGPRQLDGIASWWSHQKAVYGLAVERATREKQLKHPAPSGSPRLKAKIDRGRAAPQGRAQRSVGRSPGGGRGQGGARPREPHGPDLPRSRRTSRPSTADIEGLPRTAHPGQRRAAILRSRRGASPTWRPDQEQLRRGAATPSRTTSSTELDAAPQGDGLLRPRSAGPLEEAIDEPLAADLTLQLAGKDALLADLGRLSGAYTAEDAPGPDRAGTGAALEAPSRRRIEALRGAVRGLQAVRPLLPRRVPRPRGHHHPEARRSTSASTGSTPTGSRGAARRTTELGQGEPRPAREDRRVPQDPRGAAGQPRPPADAEDSPWSRRSRGWPAGSASRRRRSREVAAEVERDPPQGCAEADAADRGRRGGDARRSSKTAKSADGRRWRGLEAEIVAPQHATWPAPGGA
ncbi:MAG: hypothetical protein MZU91_14415 [Desulfosudis oleivorans]|nr:hypothetical protein [Desulfosudis oleivorans]